MLLNYQSGTDLGSWLQEGSPQLLTLEQAATYLGLTKDALKAKVHMGRISTVDLDKKLRFDRQDLDRIVEQNKRSA